MVIQNKTIEFKFYYLFIEFGFEFSIKKYFRFCFGYIVQHAFFRSKTGRYMTNLYFFFTKFRCLPCGFFNLNNFQHYQNKR